MLIDISPEVDERFATFPGDEPYRRVVTKDMARGDDYTLSYIHTTVHVGAHADAPIHYHPEGVGIGERSLDYYLGPCQVVRVRAERGRRLVPSDIGARIEAPRVLIATGSHPDPRQWRDDFNSLSPELVDWLHGQGVMLVGIDTPSVDPADSKQLEAHQAVFRREMALLEGLALDRAQPGRYELIALPLKLMGADASPVRAVLRAHPQ